MLCRDEKGFTVAMGDFYPPLPLPPSTPPASGSRLLYSMLLLLDFQVGVPPKSCPESSTESCKEWPRVSEQIPVGREQVEEVI